MRRSRILVIDDEESVTDALRLVLLDLGHQVDSANAENAEVHRGRRLFIDFTPAGVILVRVTN